MEEVEEEEDGLCIANDVNEEDPKEEEEEEEEARPGLRSGAGIYTCSASRP